MFVDSIWPTPPELRTGKTRPSGGKRSAVTVVPPAGTAPNHASTLSSAAPSRAKRLGGHGRPAARRP
jgi:hypothetical protein